MKWYDDLYVGESIVHKTNKIKWKIRHNAGQINIYVITLASSEKNLLDIIPSHELLQRATRRSSYMSLDWQKDMMRQWKSLRL